MQALARSRGRGSLVAGGVSLALGVVLLGAGFVTKYLFFEIDALVALLLGLILVFRNARPDPWKELGVREIVAAYESLSDLFPKEMVPLGTTYAPSETGEGAVAMVPFGAPDGGPGAKASQVLTISPPGAGISSSLVGQLPDPATAGPFAMLDALPKLIAEDLDLAKSVEFKVDGNLVRMKLEGSAFHRVFARSPRVAGSLGCPIGSAVASLLAEASGSPVGVAASYEAATGAVSATFEVKGQEVRRGD